MPASDVQLAALLQTLQNIERHLACLATAHQEMARLAAQAAASPAPPR